MVVGAIVAGGLWASWQTADDPDQLQDGREALVRILRESPPEDFEPDVAFSRRLAEEGLALRSSSVGGEVLEVSVRVVDVLDGCLAGRLERGGEPTVEVRDRACR